MKQRVFDVQDVIHAECTLEPSGCRECRSLEVTYHPYIGDAYCAECGQWQLGEFPPQS